MQIAIQLILISAFIGTAVSMGKITSAAGSIAFRRFLLSGIVLLAIVAILQPGLVNSIAQVLGVGRGTDLVLYLLVIAFVGLLAMSSRRAVELSRKNTLLARSLALHNALNQESLEARHCKCESEIDTA